MIAIFCETTYQLLNALNLVYTYYKEDCEVFFPKKMFMSDVSIFLKTGEFGYIREVHYAKRDIAKRGFLRKVVFKLYRIAVGNERGILKWLYPDIDLKKNYDRIISRNRFIAGCFYNVYRQRPHVIQIEDGIGDYLLDVGSGDSTIQLGTKEKFVCDPTLIAPQGNYQLKKMPYLSRERDFLDTLESIFGYRSILTKFRRFIYFGQAFAADYGLPAFNEREKQCFSLFSNIIEEQLTVKNHPRSTASIDCGAVYLQTTIPWECCINELDGMEERVLISICSTSILTPKLLCGKEPYLIILAKLYGDLLSDLFAGEHYYEKMITLFERVKDLYMQKDKVFIPETLQELEDILWMLRAQ